MPLVGGIRRIVCILIILAAIPSAYAFGKKDTVETQTRELDSWQESVDVRERKPGKYNVLITAKDLAGNSGQAGPYNMFIDPLSDLPIVRVTNPLADIRVPGNLNVVGTCIDDDAVDHVELTFDGAEESIRAQGKEFWSYYLDTNGLTEGKHTITAFGVDVNGVKGKAYSVSWNLDRSLPETSVKNLTMGSLVSGRFELSGEVSDGNGIRRLSHSLDGGKTFRELKLFPDKRSGIWKFSFPIDSSAIDDGPGVCWFRAEDGQGSVGIYTFLFFVDNTKPSLGILHPAVNKSVNGVFALSGFARDAIGIASVSWKAGNASGEFELVKGNPYWYGEFDSRQYPGKEFDVTVTAVDVAGNSSSARLRVPVDQTADLPTISIRSPASGALVDGPVYFDGTATDDDGVASIAYSIDGAESVEIQSLGAFGVLLDGLSPGAHSVDARAVDVNGLRGLSQTAQFTVAGPLPAIAIDPLPDRYQEISDEAGGALTASVSSGAGLKEVRYAITGLGEKPVPVKLGATSAAIRVPVTPGFPYGLAEFSVIAVDIHGRETHAARAFRVTNLSVPRGLPPAADDNALRASKEVVIPASGKTPASSGIATVAIDIINPEGATFLNGAIVTLPGPGRPAPAAQKTSIAIGVDSPIPVTTVSWTANGKAQKGASPRKVSESRYEAALELDPLMSADWTMIEVTATLRDGTALAVSGLICVVRQAPASGVADSESFAWGSCARNEAGAMLLFDGASADGFYFAKPERHAASVSADKGMDGLTVSLEGDTVTVRGARDGIYRDASFLVTDTAGGKYRTPAATFVVDGSPPVATIAGSGKPTWIQKELTLTGEANDAVKGARAEFTIDGGATWKPLSIPKFDQKVDVSALEDGMVQAIVRVTDAAGRTAYARRVFEKDTSPPSVRAVMPANGDVVNGETRMFFTLEGRDRIASVEYRAPGDRGPKDKTAWKAIEPAGSMTAFVGVAERPLGERMEFRFTDQAGNSRVLGPWEFAINLEADKPIVEAHVPVEGEVVRKDFVLSGVVYDDDLPAFVRYRIDGGEWRQLDTTGSYAIPLEVRTLGDNEHRIALYAEDIRGVRGNEVTRTVRVSLEEPKASVTLPSLETTNSGVVTMSGAASDKNGIAEIEVSLDNGNSFDKASGAEAWSYRFDSRVIQDGTHVVFVRVRDKYGTEGLYSSLVNIDNTPPSLRLELPLDGSRCGETLFVSGQTMDNLGLSKVSARISGLDPKQPAVPPSLAEIALGDELIVSRGIDVRGIAEGSYNLELRGYDRAGNVSRVSRNFVISRGKDRNRIDFLYPLNGERAQGLFKVYGRVVSEDPVTSLMLYIDGIDSGATEVTSTGYFTFGVGPELIADGTHRLTIRALLSDDRIVSSEEHSIVYRADGPWVTVDNMTMGDFAIERPWLMGSAGYSLTEEDVLALRAKATSPDDRRTLIGKSLDRVEISFDNGKTFTRTESGKKWRYRIETGDLREGYHFMVVRAVMRNGEVAVTRSIVQIDKTLPTIRLISPGEGGRYNGDVPFSGLSSDDVGLSSVTLSLRAGDKSSYSVPSFIQGLFFDWHFWGATLYDIGVGLTFFDDNVKVQGQFGQLTAAQYATFRPGAVRRYGGNVIALKMLMNLVYFPVDFILGPDFSWLSATGAIGANFSWFSESQSGKPQILSAILAQLEFPRVIIPKRDFLRTFSLYTEFQLWFIPTDVESSTVNIDSVKPQITGGIRLSVF